MTLPSKPNPGIYRKYLVKRLRDREHKHRRCEFFVLDLMHDPFAAPALEAYAAACEKTHAPLATDLRIKASDVRGRFPVSPSGGSTDGA